MRAAGGTEDVRHLAARQIGALHRQLPDSNPWQLVQRVSCHAPHRTHHASPAGPPHAPWSLGSQLRPLLSSRSWETRIAAGSALAAIAKNVPPWAGRLRGPAASVASAAAASAPPSLLSFSTFNVDTVVNEGAALLGSSGAEFDGLPGTRVESQHRNLRERLGLRHFDKDSALEEMIGDEDLTTQGERASERKRSAAEMIGAGDADHGLTVREKNRAKRLARQRAQVPGESDSASSGHRDLTAPGSDEDGQNPVEPWPFCALCSCMRQAILHQAWEVRHGAAVALRALVRAHALSLGAHGDADAAEQRAQNRQFSEDLAVRICCVIALDHFGDYASESVVAPVRETCAQVLGALAVNLEPAQVRALTAALIRMQVRQEWHVRHASFLALKYTMALRQGDMLEELAPVLLPSILKGLHDADDEVRAAAAATLEPLCQKLVSVGDAAHHLQSASDRCWAMLLDDDSNVTTIATMKLAAALHISDGSESAQVPTFCARARGMLRFLAHESLEVRRQALTLLPGAVDAAVSCAVSQMEQVDSSFATQVLCRLFHALLCETAHDLCQEGARVWRSVVVALREHLIGTTALLRAWLQLVSTADGAAASSRVVAEAFVGKDDLPTSVVMDGDANAAQAARLRCCQALGFLTESWPREKASAAVRAALSQFGNSRSAYERQCVALLVAHAPPLFANDQSVHTVLLDVCRTACIDLERGQPYLELHALHSSLLRQCDELKRGLEQAAASTASSAELQLELSRLASTSDIVETALQICTEVFDKFADSQQGDLKQLLLQQREATAATVGRFAQERARVDTAVMSSGAAALASMGQIPSKLNPIVKSLVGAVKREQCDSLRTLAAKALVQVMQWCSENGKSKVRDRIVSNVCLLLCDSTAVTDADEDAREVLDEDEVDDEAARQHASSGGLKVLAHLCSAHGESIFGTHGVPVLRAVASAALERQKAATSVPSGEELVEVTKSLRVCGALSAHLSGTALSDLLSSLPAVFHCLRHGYSPMLTAACCCLSSMAKANTAAVMEVVLGDGMAMLGDSRSESARVGAAVALREIMSALGVQVVPFLPLLVVPLLAAMSDSKAAVRRIAAHCFSALVKLMPLEEPELQPAMPPAMLATRDAQRAFVAQLVGERPPNGYVVGIAANTPLRKYQQEGVNWLAFLKSFKLHGILCDEMGLGKTLTTLSIIVGDTHDREQGYAKTKSSDCAPLPSLVVCPATLVGHWHDEVHKHFGERLKAVQYAGNPQQRASLRPSLRGGIVVIMSYETARADIDFLASCSFNYCVLDEGHMIRNSKAKVSQAVKRLCSNHRLILSGTPVQNNVRELWSMFDYLMPGFLGTERAFNARFSKPIDRGRSSRGGDASILAMEALHRQVLPFILGRRKREVLKDLPEKIIQDVMCDISPLQKRLYSEFEASQACSDCVDMLSAGKREGSANVLQSLQHMRKISNHPALVLTPSHPLHGPITAELAASGSSLHDLQHAPKLIALRQLLADCGIGRSVTTSFTCDAAPDMPAQHRVLLFCQLKSFISIIESDLMAHLPSVSYLRLDGDVPPADRQGIVRRFNSDPTIDILLLTTRVGGLGLNLTGADTVIFMEHDWNPAADMQAMDRAHRLGQKKVVNVYRLISRGTLEEKIMSLQDFKKKVARTVVSADNTNVMTMDTQSIMTLFNQQEAAAPDQGTQRGDQEREQTSQQYAQEFDMAAGLPM